MNLSSRNLKLIIGVFYLLILFFGLYYLFSLIDIRDLTSYEFIKSNKEIIIDYKNNNFLFLTIIFFLFSSISRITPNAALLNANGSFELVGF